MDVIGIPAFKRGFHCAQAQAANAGQVVAGAVEGAAAVRAEHPGLVRNGAVFLQQFLSPGDAEAAAVDGADGDIGRALRLAAHGAVAHRDFVDLAVILVAYAVAEASSGDHCLFLPDCFAGSCRVCWRRSLTASAMPRKSRHSRPVP